MVGLATQIIPVCAYSLMTKEPVQNALNTSEAPMTILRLVGAIYPPGAWAKSPAPHIPPEEIDESWQLRGDLLSWAWRAIGERKENGVSSDVMFPHFYSQSAS
jgi:hypothetical protein